MTVDPKILARVPGRVTNDDLRRLTDKMHEAGLLTSCMTCVHFKEEATQTSALYPNSLLQPAETCLLYNQRPPARVIAYGCPSWDDVPF